ncbi:MAG TPA: zf-HC2 domain-containing protein [Gemmatales bacterium]|nr:zf-HC2 domain-containing protein [Gemmatales bacterium]
MLSESLQELLSAYVDGELSPTEYERVMSALRDSAIARDYVAGLRSMSKQLKALPTLQCPPQFTTKFLQERKQVQVKSRNRRYGMIAAIAASLFIGVGIWWYVNQPGPGTLPVLGNGNIAKNTIPQPTSPEQGPIIVPKPKFDLSSYASLAQEALAAGYDELDLWQERLSQSIAWLNQAEAIREGKFQANQSTLLTGPVKQSGNVFKTLEIPIPLFSTPADFKLSSLQERWSKKGLFVLDLSSKDTVKTLRRLIEAGQEAKVPLVVDDEVKQRLAKQLPAIFMVYLENVTEEQVAAWLKAFEKADYWPSSELRGDATCQSLLLYSLDAQGRTQVARSLGLAPEQWAQPVSTGAASKAVALSYYSYRLPTSLSEESRKAVAGLKGPMKDRLSLVVMVRAGK